MSRQYDAHVTAWENHMDAEYVAMTCELYWLSRYNRKEAEKVLAHLTRAKQDEVLREYEKFKKEG
jgi:hypothetical protein